MRSHLERASELVIVLSLACLGPLLFRPVLVLLAQAAGVPPIAGGVASETGEWGSSVVWAFLASSGLEWLKRKSWFALLSERSAWWWQRIVGILLAMSTAAGIHFSFAPETGTLMVTGLVFASVQKAAFESLRQFVLNEVMYRTTVKAYGR